MKIAVPDVISNSYFPAAAAVELGFFAREGLDVSLELIFPVDRAYAALRDGKTDFVGGSAHSVPFAFPEWKGGKLLGSLAQNMYWFLVLRKDLKAKKGDINAIRGLSIGAAPLVDLGLKRLLTESGIDPEKDVKIVPVPGAFLPGVVTFRDLDDVDAMLAAAAVSRIIAVLAGLPKHPQLNTFLINFLVFRMYGLARCLASMLCIVVRRWWRLYAMTRCS